MLTLEKLKTIEPNTIFAQGEIEDSPLGVNINNSEKLLRWIAIRGGIHDWTIYCHFAHKSYEWIKQFGNKIYFPQHIKKLVPCDKETFDMYRF